MECNIGKFDRILRRSIGLVILGLGVYFNNWLGILGLLPIALSYVNFCPLYMPFKINTNKGEYNNDRNNQ